MAPCRPAHRGAFTLVELLVVIAIIAILAAIIFPVFMKAKESAYRSGDMSNMNAIRNALQLYRADQEAYPPQILGYASFYDPGMTQVVPATQLRAALYPKRIDSMQTMRPAYDRSNNTDLTSARWPNADSRAVGSAPYKDTNGDGVVDSNDDTSQARQAYTHQDFFCDPTMAAAAGGCDSPFETTGAQTVNQGGKAAPFYQISGYDVAKVSDQNLGDIWELHYALRWSSYAMGGGNRQDDPRQLIYSNPPDDTVVTWDSWFRDYDVNKLPTHTKKDFVLFLGGNARPYDSADVSDRSWRVTP